MPRRAVEPTQLQRLEALAQDQSRVATRKQLRRIGVDHRGVRRAVAAGRWQTVGAHLVVLQTGPLSLRQRQWAAVLHSGEGAALIGLSAAQAEGLRGFEPIVLETCVPHGSRATKLDHRLVQVRVVQSRVIKDVHPVRRPQRERLPSAIITAASHASTHARARLIVISAVQQRIVRASDLRDELMRRLKISRRAVIDESIADAEGGLHSLPEREWAAIVRRHRFPQASHQQPVRRWNGMWYLDCDFDGFGVSVEINGVHHDAVELADSDSHRRNVLGIGGRLVITISAFAVRHQPDHAAAVVAAALLARGWQPTTATLRCLQRAADRALVDLGSGDRINRSG